MTEDLKPWFPLCTERLLLREFTPADFDDVHAYAIEPDVVATWTGAPTRLRRPRRP